MSRLTEEQIVTEMDYKENIAYLLEDETPEGAANALKAILSTPLSQRREKGRAAREFVLKNKSNLTQTKKIIDFLPILKNKRNEK